MGKCSDGYMRRLKDMGKQMTTLGSDVMLGITREVTNQVNEAFSYLKKEELDANNCSS